MRYDILIVDDNPDDLELCQKALEKAGGETYAIHKSDSGNDAIGKIKIRRPDAVLLDYSLPGHDGISVLKTIKSIDPLLPVIMLTGKGNETIAVQAMKEGAHDYIVKSAIAPKPLSTAVNAAIDYACNEQKIREQRARIEQQAEELERINEELETFTYIASHDLRSPLVNLRGFCGELHRSIDAVLPMLQNILPQLSEIEREILRKEVCQQIPKSLTYITTAAEKMDRMTDAILKLSRLGRREVKIEPIKTRVLVDQCLAPLAHQIKQTGTKVEIGDLPDIIGDRVSIEQIFSNLLDNAVKYLDQSRPGHIIISGSGNDERAQFTVADNGRGIAGEDRHKVFEIFRRAGEVDGIPGEGMGMPYVRSIVKRYGGRIWFESALGKGTSFHFTIARQEPMREAV